jgi:hypothetical protein
MCGRVPGFKIAVTPTTPCALLPTPQWTVYVCACPLVPTLPVTEYAPPELPAKQLEGWWRLGMGNEKDFRAIFFCLVDCALSEHTFRSSTGQSDLGPRRKTRCNCLTLGIGRQDHDSVGESCRGFCCIWGNPFHLTFPNVFPDKHDELLVAAQLSEWLRLRPNEAGTGNLMEISLK